jgi:hypothetical protein
MALHDLYIYTLRKEEYRGETIQCRMQMSEKKKATCASMSIGDNGNECARLIQSII